MKIIGILGEAGSGKDTAGQFLVQECGAYSIALADSLKLFCMWMFKWSPDQLWGPSERRNEPDPDYPFYRCPSCGFHWPDTATEVISAEMDKRDSYICPICYGERVPAEWRANFSPRFALQDLGTEWARYFYRNCHIDFALKRARAVESGIEFDPLYPVLPVNVREARCAEMGVCPSLVYVSDCRFRNEVTAIQGAGGKVYRIVREQKDDNTTTGLPNHASEMEQLEIKDEEVDDVIENFGTLDALRERVKGLIAES